MKVNGEQLELKKETSLEDFLKAQGYNINRIAVELNDRIVPKESFGTVELKNSDVMEVVHFMGGGTSRA